VRQGCKNGLGVGAMGGKVARDLCDRKTRSRLDRDDNSATLALARHGDLVGINEVEPTHRIDEAHGVGI